VWLRLVRQVDSAVLTSVERALDRHHPNPDLGIVPYAAVLHLRACLETGLWANAQGYHSAAIGVLRHSVEALTLIDLGFQEPEYSSQLLEGWKAGNKSAGEIRKYLERDVWPRYGIGLWSESWADFFGNLARAVQPFAHYSRELMYWQLFVPSQPAPTLSEATHNILAALRCPTNDPVKAAFDAVERHDRLDVREDSHGESTLMARPPQRTRCFRLGDRRLQAARPGRNLE